VNKLGILLNVIVDIVSGNAIPTRFVVVFVAALANTLSYIMRTNMSVTIVAMVNHTSANGPDQTCLVADGVNQTSPVKVNFILL